MFARCALVTLLIPQGNQVCIALYIRAFQQEIEQVFLILIVLTEKFKHINNTLKTLTKFSDEA